MTELDVQWFKRCHEAGLVRSRMLEVGAARIEGSSNLCDIAKELGIKQAVGVDMESHDGVDVVTDFGLPRDEFRTQWSFGKFCTVCIFNVLEHTFDPLTVLTNALWCVEAGGTLLVVTPSVWPIHNYPGDFNRLLPDWYLAFSKLYQLNLLDEQFCWLSQFGIEPINSQSEVTLPTFLTRGRRNGTSRYWISRIGHKLFNTYGRSHWATHSAIAAAFVRG